MPRLHPAFTAVALSVVLAACGGGGGGGSDPVDKYVGTWEFPCSRDGSSSENGTLTLNKASESTANGSIAYRAYGNTTCAGAPTVALSLPAAVTVQGTGTVDGKEVDKVTATLGSDSSKDIFYVEGNRLFESPENSAIDADGYPTSLDMSSAWIKN